MPPWNPLLRQQQSPTAPTPFQATSISKALLRRAGKFVLCNLLTEAKALASKPPTYVAEILVYRIPSTKPRVLRRSSRSTSSHTASSCAGQEETQTWNQDESASVHKRKSAVKGHQRKRPYSVAPAIKGSPRPTDGGIQSQSKRGGRPRKVGPIRSKIARESESERNIRKRHDASSNSDDRDRENWLQNAQERASRPSVIGIAPVSDMLCPMARQAVNLHEDWSGRQPLLMDIVLDMKDFARRHANVPQTTLCHWCEHLCLHEDPPHRHAMQSSGADTFGDGYTSHSRLGGAYPVPVYDSSIAVHWPGNPVLCVDMDQQVLQHDCQLQQMQSDYHLYGNSNDNNTPRNLGTRFPESGERSTVLWDSSSTSA